MIYSGLSIGKDLSSNVTLMVPWYHGDDGNDVDGGGDDGDDCEFITGILLGTTGTSAVCATKMRTAHILVNIDIIFTTYFVAVHWNGILELYLLSSLFEYYFSCNSIFQFECHFSCNALWQRVCGQRIRLLQFLAESGI